MNRSLLTRIAGATGAALIALVFLGGVAIGAVEILRAPAVPPPESLGPLFLALGPVVLGSGLPLAVLIGLATTLSRFREEGEWLALQAAGFGGASLLPTLLVAALSTASASAALSHWLEPAARARIREVLREEIYPAPGRILDLGTAVLSVDGAADGELSGLFFAWEEGESLVVGTASSGRIEEDRLVLEEGMLHFPGELAVGATFDRAEIPLTLPKARVELVERDDRAMRELISRMEATGRDASYERAVLEKRSAWPAASALMVLLAAPLALSGRSWAAALSVLIYWAAVRGFDSAAALVGGLAAAWTPPALLLAAALAVWIRWRER